jgi:glyoxylase-like metal-dependent hydrolase (beta-lactamase superfamily II)
VPLGPRVRVDLLRVGHCRHPEWMALRGGRLGPVEFPAHCALVRHPTEGPILFDTGYAERFTEATARFPGRLYRWITPVRLPAEERLVAQLRGLGVAPEEVRTVVVSHLHADHVSGLRDLPAARFVLLRAEADSTCGLRSWRALRRGFLPALLPDDFQARAAWADDRPSVALGEAFAPLERGFDLLGDGSLLGIPLPGHTPGQLGLLVRREDGRPILLAGDAAWSTRAWREGRPPAPPVRLLMHDWAMYLRTLRALPLLVERQPDLLVVPSHCTQAARELRAS